MTEQLRKDRVKNQALRPKKKKTTAKEKDVMQREITEMNELMRDNEQIKKMVYETARKYDMLKTFGDATQQREDARAVRDVEEAEDYDWRKDYKA